MGDWDSNWAAQWASATRNWASVTYDLSTFGEECSPSVEQLQAILEKPFDGNYRDDFSVITDLITEHGLAGLHPDIADTTIVAPLIDKYSQCVSKSGRKRFERLIKCAIDNGLNYSHLKALRAALAISHCSIELFDMLLDGHEADQLVMSEIWKSPSSVAFEYFSRLSALSNSNLSSIPFHYDKLIKSNNAHKTQLITLFGKTGSKMRTSHFEAALTSKDRTLITFLAHPDNGHLFDPRIDVLKLVVSNDNLAESAKLEFIGLFVREPFAYSVNPEHIKTAVDYGDVMTLDRLFSLLPADTDLSDKRLFNSWFKRNLIHMFYNYSDGEDTSSQGYDKLAAIVEKFFTTDPNYLIDSSGRFQMEKLTTPLRVDLVPIILKNHRHCANKIFFELSNFVGRRYLLTQRHRPTIEGMTKQFILMDSGKLDPFEATELLVDLVTYGDDGLIEDMVMIPGVVQLLHKSNSFVKAGILKLWVEEGIVFTVDDYRLAFKQKDIACKAIMITQITETIIQQLENDSDSSTFNCSFYDHLIANDIEFCCNKEYYECLEVLFNKFHIKPSIRYAFYAIKHLPYYAGDLVVSYLKQDRWKYIVAKLIQANTRRTKRSRSLVTIVNSCLERYSVETYGCESTNQTAASFELLNKVVDCEIANGNMVTHGDIEDEFYRFKYAIKEQHFSDLVGKRYAIYLLLLRANADEQMKKELQCNIPDLVHCILTNTTKREPLIPPPEMRHYTRSREIIPVQTKHVVAIDQCLVGIVDMTVNKYQLNLNYLNDSGSSIIPFLFDLFITRKDDQANILLICNIILSHPDIELNKKLIFKHQEQRITYPLLFLIEIYTTLTDEQPNTMKLLDMVLCQPRLDLSNTMMSINDQTIIEVNAISMALRFGHYNIVIRLIFAGADFRKLDLSPIMRHPGWSQVAAKVLHLLDLALLVNRSEVIIAWIEDQPANTVKTLFKQAAIVLYNQGTYEDKVNLINYCRIEQKNFYLTLHVLTDIYRTRPYEQQNIRNLLDIALGEDN